MMSEDTVRLLTINTGSSSLKAGLYRSKIEGRHDPEPELSAYVDRIGLSKGRILVQGQHGESLYEGQTDLANHRAALEALLDWLRREEYSERLNGVGHRVVHGGGEYSEPQLIDERVVKTLRDLVPIDPSHLPQAIEAIEAVGGAFPSIAQIACFDTAFHRHMPRVAQIYPLPRRFTEMGVVRYGFHGLSYEYIMQELQAVDSEAAGGRVIVAHLGNGASMAAVRDGRGIDTTMGFTPTGGLVMGTRSGDLDPGVVLYLLRSQGLSDDDLSDLLNRQSGMLGISGSSGDMRDLLDRETSDPHAAQAVDLFCYWARKHLGALATALGGLDTLVFTGGIGEHAAPVRDRICAGLEFLGIGLDSSKNSVHAAIVSRQDSRVTVRVMPTDEDRMIARHTYRILSQRGALRVPI